MHGISAASEPAANAHALIEAERVALFLDFDGTLVEIASRPDRVGLTPATLPLLQRVRERLDGALAVVSGRSIEDIDGYLDPLVLPAAGIHGLVRRDAEGLLHTGEIDDQAMVGVLAEVAPIAVAYPQILIETKPSAVALHYRAHPKLEGVCKAAAQRIAAGRPNLQVLHGKMVVEIKPKGPHKGTAIKGFMAEPPFSGRCPIYFGDDTTDEDAFLAVNALGGMSIKVGAGKTVARNRVAGPAELHAWLASLASVGWAPLPAA